MSEEPQNTNLRHILAAAIGLVIVAGAWLAFTTEPASSTTGTAPGALAALQPQLVTRRPAPDFALPDREGDQQRLRDHRGEPVVLNFWSIDCPPCVQEMPSLVELDRFARRRGGFSVITVSVDASWEAVSQLFPQGTDLTVLFDPERAVVQQLYGTERYPETFFIDAEGNIRARFDGARDWSNPAVLQALEEL